MKQNLTEIVAILDRSGSMSNLVEDTIGGFNSFIKEQKKIEGDANVTLVIFDDSYEVVYSGVDIKEVPELTDSVYFARGMTALLDAVGKTINEVGARLKNTPESERPENVLFLITTDGMENSSSEFTGSQIAEMVKHQEDKYSWEFVFLGANIDAFGVGDSYGFAGTNTMNFNATKDGVAVLYSALSTKTANVRGGVDFNSMEDYMAEAEDGMDKK